MMAEWKEFTGSDEQIAEMRDATHGWIVEYIDTDEQVCTAISQICFLAPQYPEVIRKYLICNLHPLADMICQQAQTCQPVWVKEGKHHNHPFVYVTNDPNWNLQNAEYSFTEFKWKV